MKNRKKYIFSILMIGLFLISCDENSLDVVPQGQLSDATFWETEEDVELALAGAYHAWEYDINVIYNDAFSDNAFEQYNWGFRQLGNGEVTPQSFVPTLSGHDYFSYNRIRKYNNFLTKIEDVPMDAAKKEQYKAEVRFLRAYDYFNKVMFFGDMPLITELTESSVKPSRNPANEIKQFILDELDEISGILLVQNVRQSQGHITSGAALALKARLELYMERYSEAMTSSKEVIDMGVYELFPDYRGLFLKENNSANMEAIAEKQYLKNAGGWDITSSIPILTLTAREAGWGGLNPTKDIVDAYETSNGLPIDEDPSYDPQNPFENRDPRLEMSIIYSGQEWNGRYFNSVDQQIPDGNGNMIDNVDFYTAANSSNGGLSLKKYMRPVPAEDLRNDDQNVMIIRLAEMYLTYAEAAVETGQNLGLAVDYINRLRNRAGHVTITEADLTRELVRRERRVELAFEGLRYFDIKRWDIGSEALNGPVYGTRMGDMNDTTGEVTWGDDYVQLEIRQFRPERNYLFPIPQSEIDANTNMTQNPGY